jgi:hypothetical protein
MTRDDHIVELSAERLDEYVCYRRWREREVLCIVANLDPALPRTNEQSLAEAPLLSEVRRHVEDAVWPEATTGNQLRVDRGPATRTFLDGLPPEKRKQIEEGVRAHVLFVGWEVEPATFVEWFLEDSRNRKLFPRCKLTERHRLLSRGLSAATSFEERPNPAVEEVPEAVLEQPACGAGAHQPAVADERSQSERIASLRHFVETLPNFRVSTPQQRQDAVAALLEIRMESDIPTFEKEIWQEAGYEDKSVFQDWKRGEPPVSAMADKAFRNAMIKLLPPL